MGAHARIGPDWPHLMRRRTAALYCDMTEAEFEREVVSARFPMPVRIGDEDRWSRPQLDAALDRLTGDKIPDWKSKAKFYATKS